VPPEQDQSPEGDGVNALEQRRRELAERRQRREPLPPRHPRAEQPPAIQPGPAAGQQPSRTPVAKRPASRDGASVPLRLGQFYVTASQDEALRRIRATGLMENMDVSGSAVVRYALDQLLASKTPDELARLLGTPKGQKQDRRGRPRR
jgi:hypothetical protein